MARHVVRLYFDLISPYSYLALTQAESFGERHRIDWQVRPILYGAILDVTGLVGPAEEASKRQYTARDIIRAADQLGVPLIGPPAHPFNPLMALRTVCLYQDHPHALQLAFELADRCWGQGRPLTEHTVLEDALRTTALDGVDLAARITAPTTKARLKANTDEALAAGVFGVPTFLWQGEIFWGHDRMGHLADRLTERLDSPEPRAQAWVARPRDAERPSSPWPRS
ncbi:MAG: 2-hydroxychromene-2-carboxylate isomerase [Gemmatimonadetes bacterium]|nr:2-hydroxychromene-2-carboxylate isomerase [Gemmatimonadota bacterium]